MSSAQFLRLTNATLVNTQDIPTTFETFNVVYVNVSNVKAIEKTDSTYFVVMTTISLDSSNCDTYMVSSKPVVCSLNDIE